METERWTLSMTKSLIERYKALRSNVGTDKMRSLKKMWEVISEEMNNAGYKVTPSFCENKWKVLTRSYKKIINKNKRRRVFEFEKEMAEIYANEKMLFSEVLIPTKLEIIPHEPPIAEDEVEVATENYVITTLDSCGDGVNAFASGSGVGSRNAFLSNNGTNIKKRRLQLRKKTIAEQVREDMKTRFEELMKFKREKQEQKRKFEEKKLEILSATNTLLEKQNELIQKRFDLLEKSLVYNCVENEKD